MDLLLEKKAFAHLATLMPDGSPQNTPVWFDFEDGKVRVNSALGRTKTRNMKQGAKVALSIMDPNNPDRYVQLRGTVTGVWQDDVAAAHIGQLARRTQAGLAVCCSASGKAVRRRRMDADAVTTITPILSS